MHLLRRTTKELPRGGTDRDLLDEQRELLSAQRELAAQALGTAMWTWDAVQDRLLAQEGMVALIGLDPEGNATMRDALDYMHEDDRPRALEALAQLRSCAADVIDLAYRVVDSDGTTRWLRAYCSAVRDEEKKLLRIVGVTTDVTSLISAQQESQATAEFWQATLDAIATFVAVLDEHGSILAVNRSWREAARLARISEDFVGRSYPEVCESSQRSLGAKMSEALKPVLLGEKQETTFEYEAEIDGAPRWRFVRATRCPGYGPARVVVAHEDVTMRREAEHDASLRAALLDEIDAAVIEMDLTQRITTWSSGAERIYGWKSEEVIGLRFEDVCMPPERGDLASVVRDALIRDGRWMGDLPAIRRDGSPVAAFGRARVLFDENQRPRSLVGHIVDISARKESERELKKARDYLRAVADSMGEALLTVDPSGRTEYVNPVAERLLGWSAEELRGRPLHPILCPRDADGEPISEEQSAIHRARSEGHVVRVTDALFARADGAELPVEYTAAPFAAESGIAGCVVVFEDISKRKEKEQRIAGDLEKLAWARRIRRALAEEHFVLFAQPIRDTDTGELVQQELLIRMRDPETGEIVAPGMFLPVAEEFGLIGEVDRWVIDRAAEIAASGCSVELNVSARSIDEGESLLAHIEHAIKNSGADPRRLVFEITETAMVGSDTAARAFVERLHGLGCRIALDDFGTGFGGFTYLKQLPVDFLKIDVEFVRDLRNNPASLRVVEAVVSLARGFDLKTVGEGVEDGETVQLLRSLGVDYMQGFHLGRPAPFEAASATTRSKGEKGGRTARRSPAAATRA